MTMKLTSSANIFARIDAQKAPALWRLCDILSAKAGLPPLDNILIGVGDDPCIYEKSDREESDFGEALHIPYCIAVFMSDKELEMWLHLFLANMKYGYDVLPGKNYPNSESIDLDIHEIREALAAEYGKLELWAVRVKGQALRHLWAEYGRSPAFAETIGREPWMALPRFKTTYLPLTSASIRSALESGFVKEQYWSYLPDVLSSNNVDLTALIAAISGSKVSNAVIDVTNAYIESGVTGIFTNEWLLLKAAKALISPQE